MTTTPLFGTLAQDATLQLLIAQAVAAPQSFGMAGVGSTAQIDTTGKTSVTAQVAGQSGSVTLQPQVSDDGGTWTVLSNTDAVDNVGVATGAQAATITANGTYRFDTKGFPFFRLYQSAGTGSNTVTMAASVGLSSLRLSLGGPIRVPAQAAGTTDPGMQILGFRSPAAPAARSAAGAYTAFLADQEGKQVVVPHGATELQWQQTVAATTTAAALKAAGATGIRNFATWATVDNASASAVRAAIYDGATMIWSGSCPANDSRHFVFPTPLKGTAATAMNATMLTGAAQVTAGGFQGI